MRNLFPDDILNEADTVVSCVNVDCFRREDQLYHVADSLLAERKASVLRVADWIETQRNEIPAHGWEFAAAIRELAKIDVLHVGTESGTVANSEMHQRPSINDEPYPEAGPQAEASPAGTGSGTLADREGRHEGEAVLADLPTNSTACQHCRNGFLDNRYGQDVECINGILIDIDVACEGWQRDVHYPVAPCHPLWQAQVDAGPDGYVPNDCQERLEDWASCASDDRRDDHLNISKAASPIQTTLVDENGAAQRGGGASKVVCPALIDDVGGK